MTDITSFTYVQDAIGMAEHEPDRIKPVSVLKATGANVVVFNFDAGTELREHTAQHPALLQALAGVLNVSVGGQTFQLRPGDLLHIEPFVPHSVTAVGQGKLQLTVLMIDSPGPSKVPLSEG